MATFESRIHALHIETHPNADRLELAAVGGFRCVVAKGSFADGDLAAYIPEGSVCPDWLIAELGLEGKLAGSRKNRVKAVKLRGALSQGLVYPVRDGMVRGRPVAEGDTVTELLELVKYEPPIPIAMQGEVQPVHGATLRYDIENVKKYPDEFQDGEPVVITEKLHGSWCCLGWHPDHGPIVTSKGMSDRGMALILNEANENNLYVRTWRAFEAAFETARARLAGAGQPFYVLGEVYGRGVQDMHYEEPNPRSGCSTRTSASRVAAATCPRARSRRRWATCFRWSPSCTAGRSARRCCSERPMARLPSAAGICGRASS